MSYQTNQVFYSRRQQNWSRNQNTVAFKPETKIGPVSHIILMALAIAILGMIYLTQATKTSGYDYATQKMDSQIAELNNQKNDLEVENARLTSLENIKNSAVASTMSPTTSVNYVD